MGDTAAAYAAHVERLVRGGLDAIPDADAQDLYVLGLWLDAEEAEMFRPELAVTYNTESQVTRQLSPGVDAHEVRWNFACWLQNRLGVIGSQEDDPVGADLLDALLRDKGLTYDWDTVEPMEEQEIMAKIMDLLLPIYERLIHALHHDGTVERAAGGRRVPLCMIDVHADEDLLAINGRANPPGVGEPNAYTGLR